MPRIMSDHKEAMRRGLSAQGGHRGFSGRTSLDEATAWIDACGAAPRAEEIALSAAAGRRLAVPLDAPWEIPPADRAAADGYALRSADTVGASDYTPLELRAGEACEELTAGAASPIVAGAPLPRGADAILPFEAARERGSTLEVFSAVAEGWGIQRKGQQVQAGARLCEALHRLRPQDIGLLALLGVERLRVVARPRVRLLVFPPKGCGDAGGREDANTPMLRTLVERDGGSVGEATALDSGESGALTEQLTGELAGLREEGGAELIVVAGRSGMGWDDEAAQAIAGAGELSIHGIALRPGGSAGMGVVGGAPVLLLPGDPLGCFCAYEMLAGRLIRRLGGGAPELPYEMAEAEVGRKIVSAVGVVELCRVRLEQGRVELIGSAVSGGVASAVRADGFVVVPAALEGYAPGSRVSVYLYGGRQ